MRVSEQMGALPVSYEAAMELPPGTKSQYCVFTWPIKIVALTPAGMVNFYPVQARYGITTKPVLPVQEFMYALRLTVSAAGYPGVAAHIGKIPDGLAKAWLYAVQYGDDRAIEAIEQRVLTESAAGFAEFVEQTAVGDELQEDEASIRSRKLRYVANRLPADVVHDRNGNAITESGKVYGPEILVAHRERLRGVHGKEQ